MLFRSVGFHPHAKIDVEGIDNHRMTGLNISTVAATVKSNIGDIIIVLHHYGYTGKGNTIICPGQLEWNKCVISDKSTLVGGEQTITDGPTGTIQYKTS